MKPKLLKIKGLNSFIEEQVIDFLKLTEKGLFGIFGPTGSGKSSILDAITLALYGQVARKSTMYINTEVDNLYIYFKFESGYGTGRKNYIIERSLKRTKTNGIKTVSAKLIRINNTGEIENVVEGRTSIEKEIQNSVIGLNFEDFIRTVVLPQGKFSEFLTLTGAERNKMLERLLGLQDYGDKLNIKVKAKRDTYNNELNKLTGELNRYEGIDEDLLTKLQIEYKSLVEREEEIAKKEILVNKRYEESKRICDLYAELDGYLKKEIDLNKQEENIKKMKIKLLNGKNALNVIPYINNINKVQKDIKENKSILNKYQDELEKLINKIKCTESDYKLALKKKEKELPLLFEKKSKLDYAIDLIKEKEILEKERERLVEKYKNYEAKLKLDDEKLQKTNQTRKSIEKEIEKIEELIKHKTVTSEYRKKITEASELEKRYKALLEDKEECEKILNKLENNINKTSREIDRLKKQKESKDIELNKRKEIILELENNRPDDNKEISLLQIKIYELSNKISKYHEINSKVINLSKENNNYSNQLQKIELLLNESRNKLERKLNLREEILKKIKEIEYKNMASILNKQLVEGMPCPVCGSTHHPNIVSNSNEIELEDMNNELKKIDQEIDEIQKQVNTLEAEHNVLLSEIKRTKKEIKENSLEIMNVNLEDLIKEKEKLEIKIEESQEYSEKWNITFKDINNEINKYNEAKNQLINSEIELLTNMKKDKETLSEMKERFNTIFKDIQKVSSDYDGIRKELKLDNISNKLKEIDRYDKEIEVLNGQLKELREKNKKLELERNTLDEIVNKFKEEMKVIINSGKEKREIIDKYQVNIKKVAGNVNPVELKNETEKLIKEITGNELKLRNILESENKEINKLKEEKFGVEKSIKTLESSEVDIKAKLVKALEENSFSNIDEVLLYLEDKQKLGMMESEINKFDKELNNVISNIERIKKELQNDTFDEKEWDNLKIERERIKDVHEELLKDIGQKKERIHEIQNNLAEIKQLNSEKKKLEHKKDILTDILELTKAKRFVEFVSRSHLKYIAQVATKKLKEITRERYGLELDINNNFMIVDNYNGGIKRECNSLSGGETFLTSLSLALALSSKIQLKGNTSIEFFFLDEGFGTLDNSLLDIVMTSLERLYKEELSVGIISHVEELRNRVPVKLIVSPPVAGVRGTNVDIEYS